MSNAKYNGWQNVQTLQSKEILTELIEAKEDCKALMLISDTGLGKTNTIKMFTKKMPHHTYVITIGDSYNLPSLLDDIMHKLGVYKYFNKNGKHLRIGAITNRLIEIGAEGGKPILILDEAENAKIVMLKAFKEIYDAIIENCSIVLIGTDQLVQALNKKAYGQSIPQLRRRFKAGTRYITPFNKTRDMKPFFDAYIPKELDLQDLLIRLCDNYGELHDYLDPVLRHCAKKNIQITEQVFRLYHKIPKR
jgi:DNA transposition AAA+ family ATPase